jgi:hypothetical protein
MLPRLIINIGVAAVAAGLGVFLLRGGGYEQRDYSITLTKGSDGRYHASLKSGFLLAYHGQTNWEIFNDTDDDIEFVVRNFQPQVSSGCPVKFVGNTGVGCAGTATIAARKSGAPPLVYSDVIKVKRNRSDVGVFTFDMVVNRGDPIDPDIELERDPYLLIMLLAIGGGLLSVLAGWWLGRRTRA